MAYLTIITVMKKSQQLRRHSKGVNSFPLGILREQRARGGGGKDTTALSESNSLRFYFVPASEATKELTRHFWDLTARNILGKPNVRIRDFLFDGSGQDHTTA